MIRMADGSEKAVEDVAAGDLLWNPILNKGQKVQRVIEGAEDESLIEYGYAGKRSKVTQNHPVYTEAGIKRAKELKREDRVKDEHGMWREVNLFQKLEAEEGQRVINFILEAENPTFSDHALLADGIVTGDFVVQSQLESK